MLRLRHLPLALALAALASACNCDPTQPGADGGLPDAGTVDGGPPDSGPVDAGAPDAGGADAGAPDAGTPDGGAPDAGPPDSGLACPDAGVLASSLTVTDTRHRFQGTTTAATTGEFLVQADGGQLLRGPVGTTPAGAYDVEVPLFCGPQTVTLSWPGPACADQLLFTVDRQGCTSPDLQVTLTWDDQGLDFELHLIKPGGRINDQATDCTWTSCISSSPDWGVVGDPADNPHKDVDNTGHFGPENIYLSGLESGTYWVLVEHWGSGLPTADGVVTITLRGAPSVTIPITDLAPQHVRAVATIVWATRTVTPFSLDTDCTSSWSGGCTLPLPPPP